MNSGKDVQRHTQAISNAKETAEHERKVSSNIGVKQMNTQRSAMKGSNPKRGCTSSFQEFPTSNVLHSYSKKDKPKRKVPRQVKEAPKTEMILEYIPMTSKSSSNDAKIDSAKPAMKWSNPGRDSVSKFQQFPLSKMSSSSISEKKSIIQEPSPLYSSKPKKMKSSDLKSDSIVSKREMISNFEENSVSNAYTNASTSVNYLKAKNEEIDRIQTKYVPPNSSSNSQNETVKSVANKRPAMAWSSPGKDATSKFQQFPSSNSVNRSGQENGNDMVWSKSEGGLTPSLALNRDFNTLHKGKAKNTEKGAKFDHYSETIPKRERKTKWADEKFGLTPETYHKKQKSFQMDVKIQPDIKMAPKTNEIKSFSPEIIKSDVPKTVEMKVNVSGRSIKSSNVQLKVTPERLRKSTKDAPMKYSGDIEYFPSECENLKMKSTGGRQPKAARVRVSVTPEIPKKPYRAAQTKVKVKPDVRVASKSADEFLNLPPQVPAPLPMKSTWTKIEVNPVALSSLKARPRQIATEINLELTPQFIKRSTKQNKKLKYENTTNINDASD